MRKLRPSASIGPSLLLGLLTALILGLSPQTVSAQDRPRDRLLPREEMLERFRANHERRIRQELELDAEAWAGVQAVLHRYHLRRLELLQDRIALGRQVQDSRRSREEDAHARALLEALRELRAREAQIEEEEEARLLELLEPAQLLRLRAIRTDLADRIRGVEPPRGRGRRGGDPHGGGSGSGSF
jgi:hypothetical protein